MTVLRIACRHINTNQASYTMDLGTIKMHIKLTLRIPVRRRHGRKIEICTERQFAKKLIATSIYISTYNINMAWITTKTIFMMISETRVEDTIFPSITLARKCTQHIMHSRRHLVSVTPARARMHTHISNVHSERRLLHLWHWFYRAHAHKSPTAPVLKDNTITIVCNTTS